ncbi:MAG: hypothetical protein QM805_07765 [Pseudomonas sp.]
MLDKAVQTARGKCTIDDVLAMIKEGTYVLWVVFIDNKIVAALTSRIVDYPRRKAMALDWIGGTRMKQWFGPVHRQMVIHARHNGCTHMEGYGRTAWLRWIAPMGWTEDYTAFRMEI